jgi:nicotinic acid mononucleotide adenylyltransferase
VTLTGVFPGSFDPLTTAHLAIADAAVAALGLDRLDLVMSEVALAKEHGGHSSLDDRLAAIARAATTRPHLRGRVTSHRLIADLAEGYDVCVVGADKWHQLHDVAFYGGSAVERDAALARLPRLAVVPRLGVDRPALTGSAVLLAIDPVLGEVSSTAVRAGREGWRA